MKIVEVPESAVFLVLVDPSVTMKQRDDLLAAWHDIVPNRIIVAPSTFQLLTFGDDKAKVTHTLG